MKTLENRLSDDVPKIRKRKGVFGRLARNFLIGLGTVTVSSSCIPSGCDPAPKLFKDSGPENTGAFVEETYSRTFRAESEGAFNFVDGFRVGVTSGDVSKEREIKFGLLPGTVEYGGTNINLNRLRERISGEETLPNGDILFYDTHIVTIDPPQNDLVGPHDVVVPSVVYGIDLDSFRRYSYDLGRDKAFLKVVAVNVFPGESDLRVKAFAKDGKESDTFSYQDVTVSLPTPIIPPIIDGGGVPPIIDGGGVPPIIDGGGVPPIIDGGQNGFNVVLLDEICRQGTHGRYLREADYPSIDTRVYAVSMLPDGSSLYEELPQNSGGLYDYNISFLGDNEMLVATSGGGYDREPRELLYLLERNQFPPERCNYNILPFRLEQGEVVTVVTQGFHDGLPAERAETVFREH